MLTEFKTAPSARGRARRRPAETQSGPDVATLREAARMIATTEVTDAIADALRSYDGSLSELSRRSGIDKAFLSRLANGHVNKQGCTVASLAQIALALNKTLRITIS